MSEYWFDNLPNSHNWTSLWNDYAICENCGGIRSLSDCPVCHELPKTRKFKIQQPNGAEIEIISNSAMGAEGRYEDYVYLNMLEYEWRRPESEFDQYLNFSEDKRPAKKAIIAIIFWTYFETRIERLLRAAMSDMQNSICENLLKRYQSISSRIIELYKVLFGNTNTYFSDLKSLGFYDVSELLSRIQEKRNEFMHGKPEAISNELIENLVKSLKQEHESWIAVYNFRVIKSKIKT